MVVGVVARMVGLGLRKLGCGHWAIGVPSNSGGSRGDGKKGRSRKGGGGRVDGRSMVVVWVVTGVSKGVVGLSRLIEPIELQPVTAASDITVP